MNKRLQKILEDINVLNGTELSSIVEAVKLRRNHLHFTDAQSLKVGDKVQFNGRRGAIEKAVVEKIKIKNVSKNVVAFKNSTIWNVGFKNIIEIVVFKLNFA